MPDLDSPCIRRVSLFTTITLVWDLLATPDFSKSGMVLFILFPPNWPDFFYSGSGLTRKQVHVVFNFHAGFFSLKLQRSLVIVVMILLCWITLGGLVFSLLMQLSFIDGLYFTVVSIETIGFGDIHPNSTASRVFGVVYNRFALYSPGCCPQ